MPLHLFTYPLRTAIAMRTTAFAAVLLVSLLLPRIAAAQEDTLRVPITFTAYTTVSEGGGYTNCAWEAVGSHADPVGNGRDSDYDYPFNTSAMYFDGYIGSTPSAWTGVSEDIPGERITFVASYMGSSTPTWLFDGCDFPTDLPNPDDPYAYYDPPANVPPTASFTWSVDPETFFKVDFDASASADEDGEVVRYAWDFDNDRSIDLETTSPQVSHTYDERGGHLVRLTVYDDEDAFDATSDVAEVEGPDLFYAVSYTRLDESGAESSEFPDVQVGDTVIVRVRVENDGDVPLENIRLPGAEAGIEIESDPPGALAYVRTDRATLARLEPGAEEDLVFVYEAVHDEDDGSVYVPQVEAEALGPGSGERTPITDQGEECTDVVMMLRAGGVAEAKAQSGPSRGCASFTIEPRGLQVEVTFHNVEGEVTEAPAGRERRRRDTGAFVTNHRFATLGQPARCISGCVDVEVTVTDENGDPVEGAEVNLGAPVVSGAGVVTPEQGGGFFCPLETKPGTCGRLFEMEPTDAEGKAKAIYWFPGLIEGASTTVTAVADYEDYPQATGHAGLALLPTRIEFGHNTVTPTVNDAAFLTNAAALRKATDLALILQEGCKNVAGYVLSLGGRSKPLDTALLKANKAAADWVCGKSQNGLLEKAGGKGAADKAGQVLQIIDAAKKLTELAEIYWFFTSFNLHSTGTATVVVESVAPPFLGMESDFVDAITAAFEKLAAQQYLHGIVTPLTLDIYEVSYATADGSGVDFVPALHVRLRSSGAGAVDHQALVKKGYTPASWLTEEGIATATVAAAGPGQTSLQLSSGGGTPIQASVPARHARSTASEEEPFEPGHVLVLDVGTAHEEVVQVADLVAGSLHLTAPLQFAHDAGTTASRVDSLAVGPPPAPVAIDLTAGLPGAPLAPTLTWFSGAPATSYDVQVATDSLFTALVAEATELQTPALALEPLAEGVRHYWRVRATNLLGTGPWSARYTFVPGAPEGDDLADALAVDGPTTTADTTLVVQWLVATTAEAQEVGASCAAGANSLWLALTPTRSESLTLSTAGSSFASHISVWTGDEHPLTEVACASASDDAPAEVALMVEAGTTHYVRLAGIDEDEGLATLLITPSSALPVELRSFEAVADGAGVVLRWQTASERNNAGFHVERQAGAGWEDIGFVAGAGTTTTPQTYRYTDDYTDAAAAGALRYRLRQVDHDGAATFSEAIEVAGTAPDQFALGAPYPNPFNPRTRIPYALPVESEVRLSVFDALGREVAVLVDGPQGPGQHAVAFEADRLPSGIYLVRLQAAAFVATQRVLLVK